jgi:poly-gamma-glutamate synthesis protein (capsule biosynthesis protein)
MIFAGDYAARHWGVRLELPKGVMLANLEGPILALEHGLAKAPTAAMAIWSERLPERAEVTAWALANNHMMDYGAEGLRRTLAALGAAGMAGCGAGMSLEEARRPMVVQDGAVRVAVLSVCEAQYGLADRRRCGVAELGPWMYEEIAKLKRRGDKVVVSVHQAVEMSAWPSPRVQELYRSWIEAGATVVHGHHAHVPQGVEAYRGGVIMYGLGNFLVDPNALRGFGPNGLWSLAVEVEWAEPVRFKAHTLELQEEGGKLVARVANRTKYAGYRDACDRPLKEPDLLEALWQETATRAWYQLYAEPLRGPRPGRGLDGKARARALRAGLRELMRGLLGREVLEKRARAKALLWQHFFGCQSHGEAITTAMGVLGGELTDRRTAESRRMAEEFTCLKEFSQL